MRKILAIVWAVLGISLVAIEAKGGDEVSRKETRTISVRGTGKISSVPDLALVQVGVSTQAETAKAALAANNEAMAKLHALLKERGIASKDVQTSHLQVHPQYSQPVPGRQAEFVPRVVGYRLDNMVQVKGRRLEKLGELLDSLVQVGANEIRGISFQIEESDKLLDEARKRAVADAKRTAEVLAGEAGVVLGPPISIQEGDLTPPPIRPMAFGAGAAMRAAAVPVAAGEEELRVSVQIVYELREAK